MADTGADDGLHAAVAVQHVPGTLSLPASGTEISWRPSHPSTAAVPTFHLPARCFTGLSVSVAGSASTVMLLKLDPHAPTRFHAGRLVLYFVAEPRDAAIAQREAFKERLSAIIRSNKARATAAGTAQPQEQASAAASPAPAPAPASAPAQAPATRPTPYDDRPARTELQMRIDILKANPSLLALHRQVVHSRIMSDAEFWSHPTRLTLLRAERAAEKQRRGRNARLADPKKSTEAGGEIRYSLTPQIVRDMFEQYPVVARAYADNVPDKLSEQDFWKRYFSSRLYSRLRTSTRSAASEHVIRDDDIFDQYLQDEDDDLEPRRAYNPHDALVDLAATANDHDTTGNERDWTMRPGFGGHGKRALPLLRRFNEHSQSLLDSALGGQGEGEDGEGGEGEPSRKRKRRRLVGGVGEEYAERPDGDGRSDEDEDGDDDDDEEDGERVQRGTGTRRLYDHIVIDELEQGRQRRTVPLQVQGAHRKHRRDNGGARPRRSAAEAMDVDGEEPAGQGADKMTDEEIRQLILAELERWPRLPSLGQWSAPAKEDMLRTMSRLLHNVLGGAGRDFKHETGKGLLGDALHKSLLSSHAATTEFLRQFWSAVAPASAASVRLAKAEDDGESTSTHGGGGGGGLATQLSPAQRRARALRMAGILAKSSARIRELKKEVREGKAGDGGGGGGGDGEGVEAALAFVDRALRPTMESVHRALHLAKALYNFRPS